MTAGGRLAPILLVLAASAWACRSGTERTGDDPPGGRDSRAGAEMARPEYRDHVARAAGLERRGDLRGAVAQAARALTAAPHARDPYALVSRLYVAMGNDQDAARFFELVARKFPDRPEPWYFRGYHTFRMNRWDESLRCFTRATELAPGDAENWFRRGLVLQTMGEFDAAVSALRKAVELAPSADVPAARLSRLLRVTGEYEGAERVASAALAHSPESPELLYAIGQIRMRQRRDSEAEAAFRKAIAQNPAYREPHYDLARLLARTGREEEGRREEAVARKLADAMARRGSHADDAADARSAGREQPR